MTLTEKCWLGMTYVGRGMFQSVCTEMKEGPPQLDA